LSVKIRLSRHGSKKHPYYRIVVTDSRTKRDGRVIEEVGRYNPMVEPPFIQVDLEKVDSWIGKGATPSETVSHLIETARNPEAAPAPKEKKPSKKAAAKAAAGTEAAAEAEAEKAE
jgi:small subunit ribosomal protein S16